MWSSSIENGGICGVFVIGWIPLTLFLVFSWNGGKRLLAAFSTWYSRTLGHVPCTNCT